MRTLSAILASLVFTSAVSAAPRKHNSAAKARKAAEVKFVHDCVDERTGPDVDADGKPIGITTDEAFQLCRGIVRHQHKITKLAKRAADARTAGATPRLVTRLEWECAEEVSVACEDTTVRDHDGGECSDATLEKLHAFDVCRGKAPVAEGK